MKKERIFKVLTCVLLIIFFCSFAIQVNAETYTTPWSDPTQFDNRALADDHVVSKTVRIPLAFILSIIRTVALTVAICSLIWAGIRYMFPSMSLFGKALDKAEVKRDIPRFVIGSVLLFGTSALLTFVQYLVEDVFA